MKFFELAVGDKFEYGQVVYEKIKEERISCCKVGKNAVVSGTETTAVIKPLEEVIKIEPPKAEGHIAPAKPE